MQKPKLADGATAGLDFQDSSTETSLDGTIVRAALLNDNLKNLFNIVEGAGYTLIDDDLSQLVKALKSKYDPTFTYNTSVIATQTVNDVVLGSDGNFYEAQSDGISGDDPVGSVTGDWISADTPILAKYLDASAVDTLYLVKGTHNNLQMAKFHNLGTVSVGVNGEGTFSGVTGDGGDFGVTGAGTLYDINADNINGVGKMFALNGYFPFTGAHVGFSSDENIKIGDTVIIDEVIYREVNNMYFTISETNIKNDAAIGIVSSAPIKYIPENWKFKKDKDGKYVPYRDVWDDKLEGLYRYEINSVGEGALNVCETGGNITKWDLLTSSTTSGKAEKQLDNIGYSYSIAKAAEPVDWTKEIVGQDGCFEENGIKCKLIGCIYLAG